MTKNVTKKDYIWNTMAGLINAGEAVIMSMIVTRVVDLSYAGYLTIAFAIGNLMMSIGKFGVRSFQVTDINEQFSFGEYFAARIVSCALMLASLIGFLIFGTFCRNYDKAKCLIILFIGLIYFIEALEDVFWAYFQNKNKLYLGAQIFSFRWIGILLSFLIGIIITRNVVLSLEISVSVSAIFFVIGLIYANREQRIEWIGIRLKSVKEIAINCFPIFLTSFLSFYVANSPKYALDTCVSAEIQACYGFVAMPIFVIGLLNGFIYQPILVTMAEEYQCGKTRDFVRRIRKQIMVIAGLTATCIIGAYFIGIPVLSWLYRTDLSDYIWELLILLLAGGFLALAGYFEAVFTILRCQKYLLFGYIPVSFCAFVFMGMIAPCYGTKGVAVAYLLLMALLSLIYWILLRVRAFKSALTEQDVSV